MNRFLFLLCFIILGFVVVAQKLIPEPQQTIIKSNKLVLVKNVQEKINASMKVPDEGYTLVVSPSKVMLTAKTQQGMVWARQTLRQLTDKNGMAPQVEITDYPAFAIRGFMHDTGRNFISIDMLKKHIDLLSAYKLNVFHWHLTDNPAWRIECRVFPQLNDPKFQRKGRDEGKFYTYKEIRELISYARERGITIIPEIDMPGHSKFFNDTFGFGMGTPEGMAVLEKCLNEFFAEIPAQDCPYFHVGSDEVHIANPKAFMQWAEALVRKHHRQVVAWDPGLPSDGQTIRQIWSESEGLNTATLNKQGKYLDSFMGYLNSMDPLLTTSRNFLRQACGIDKGNANAQGGILCLWNDVRVADKTKIALHNGMVNGILAFSERFWHGGSVGKSDNYCINPSPTSDAGKALATFEAKMKYHRDHLLTDWDMRWVANAQQPWRITLPQARGTQPSTMKWIETWGGAIDMRQICNQYAVKMLPTMDAWAETEIFVSNDTTISAWVGFEVAARSNRQSGGMGYQGLWENDGRLLVGNVEVFPSQQWEKPGAYGFHFETWHRPEEEIPYADEQFYWMRRPANVPLKAGWNKISLYCPRTYPGQPWSFAFIPVTVDANGHVREASGLKFR